MFSDRPVCYDRAFPQGLERELPVSQERTEAVVLRAVDFSETSRIVTFLTPGRGRMACLAKGVRRPKSALASALDLFNRLELIYYWKDSRNVQTLGEATVLDGYGGIKADLEKVTFAAFPLELAYRIAHENEPSESLYATLVRGLESLTQWPGDIQCHAVWQVLHLLSAAGFAPSLDICAETGERLTGLLGFAYAGGVTCGTARRDRPLSRSTYDALCALAGDADSCTAIGVREAAELFMLLRRYAERQLETEFRSPAVIDQMLGHRAS